MTKIQKRLFEFQDEKYRNFQSKLIPNIHNKTVIGVRTPILKGLAKEFYGTIEGESFIASLPHKYFEENQLHAFMIALEKDIDKCINLVNNFLPFIDNWATCDQLSPKCFYKRPEALLPHISSWLESNETYAVRFGIGAYMRYFLDDRFKPEYAERIAEIRSGEYYINMMLAWYFATALAKQWEAVFPVIAEKRLDAWVHNKAIQKAVESYRISDERKSILRGLKVKCLTISATNK